MTGAPTQAWASREGHLMFPRRRPVKTDDIAARQAIAEVFARYGMAHDEVAHETMADLFTKDAVLEVSIAGPVFETHRGRAAIAANFARVAATQSDQRRHAVSNIEVTLLRPDRAQARAYGLVSSADASGIRLCVSCAYTSELSCEPDGLWRFAHLWIGMDHYAGTAPGTN